MSKTKPFSIPMKVIGDAYKKVKRNKGGAGVDNITMDAFEANLENNLYKIWNRMCSGSYFPPAVKLVEIPKDETSVRKLGIPTIADRVAQTVAKLYLEAILEPLFHPDSYGYRPEKSPEDAVGVARVRCWQFDWVLDLDIKGFFDNIDHEIMMDLVKQHTDCKWILLYAERWLKASLQLEDGSLVERSKGTPQGGVISPLLANLYLHHVFDIWMKERAPSIPFVRYADDIIIHCNSKFQAETVREQVEKRLREFKLELHPEKTKIVYCRDDNRKGKYECQKFDFLGFEFRPRSAKGKNGKLFVSFIPAISPKSLKKFNQRIRNWKIQRWTQSTIENIARKINPIIRGWINYYARFYKSALEFTFYRLDWRLTKWLRAKYKRLKKSVKRAWKWLNRIKRQNPNLFAHWSLLTPKYNG